MSHIDQDDGTVVTNESELWRVTVTASIRVTVAIGGLTSRQADDLTDEDIIEAISDEVDADFDLVDWTVDDQEADE